MAQLRLMLVIAAAWTFSIWTENVSGFSRADTVTFYFHSAVVLALEALLVFAVVCGSRRGALPAFTVTLAAAAVSTFNLYTIVLTHNEVVASQPLFLWCLILFAIFLFFAGILFSASESRTMEIALGALIGVFLLLTAEGYARRLHGARENRIAAGKMPDHLDFPRFETRSNVYLISFDALVPESLAKRFIGVDKLEYMSVIREHGLRVLRNAFCDRVPTKQCLNAVSAMDLEHYDELSPSYRYLFMTGEIANPLHEMFRANGYKIQLIYKTSYFGPAEAANLDRYVIAEEAGVCEHIDNPYAFMGYCTGAAEWIRDTLFGYPKRDYRELFLETIRETARGEGPWLTMSYVRKPEHTPNSFDSQNPEEVAEFEEMFSRNEKEAASYIEELIGIIETEDPGAILVIYGDHGALTTRVRGRHLDMSDPETILDRHGVAAAVYPSGFCADEFSREPYSVVRLGRSIAKCLSGGADPLPHGYQNGGPELSKYIYE